MCMCRGLQETLRPLFLEGLGAGMEGGLGAGYGGVGPTAMAQVCPLHPLNAPYFTLVLYVLLAS